MTSHRVNKLPDTCIPVVAGFPDELPLRIGTLCVGEMDGRKLAALLQQGCQLRLGAVVRNGQLEQISVHPVRKEP